MPKSARPAPTADELLHGWPEEGRALAQQIRALVKELCPEAAERPYRGWNILGYSLGRHATWDMFCYVGWARGAVQLGFNHGKALPDPEGLLEGKAKEARSVALRPGKPFPEAAVRALISAAHAYAQFRAGGG